jgi:hypothetical protein
METPHKLFLSFVMVVLAFGITSAQMGPRSGRNMPIYNVASEVTFSGSVQEVQEFTGPRGFTGTRVILKTDAGPIQVHVGPKTYISSQQFSFARGDQVEVVGSEVNMNGSDVVLAREIKKGGKTLVLRNIQGVPNWAGRRF